MAEGGLQQGQVSGKVLMYEKPEPLNVQEHGKLGITQQNNGFDFVKELHFVPVNANEFGVAATTFPIIFAGEQKQPLAVMGLRPGDNLFIDEKNNFKPDAYVPGYIRRYPFVLAKPPEAERMIVCIDRKFSAITDKPDMPFFKDNEPTEYVQNAVEFLKQYETQRLATEQTVKRLEELDLFETREVVYNPAARGRPGQQEKITEHLAISEQKLMALAPDVLKELAEKGYLGAIYAHLISLMNWDRLIDLTLIRNQQQGAPSAEMPQNGAGGTPQATGGDVQA